jgi:hypothetical protein
MQSKAPTVDEYLTEVPKDRLAAIQQPRLMETMKSRWSIC